jgi:gentisate 1,2-dioxygenase
MSLEELNRKLKEQHLIGYWTIPNTSTGFREPEANFRPFMWKWNEIRAALDQAVHFIRPEEAFRRFIGYQHPELKLGTAHTLLMGAQMVRPGEFAPAHRHTMGAIRFVVEGYGAATVVEGEPLPMEPGDLITTPSWSWHDHINTGDTPIIWLDGADGPMLHYYQAGFANPFHDRQQAVTKPTGWSQKTYNVLRPQSAPAPISKNYRPPYRYAWKDTEKAFESIAEAPGDPYDGVLLRYADPIGGSAAPARPGSVIRSSIGNRAIRLLCRCGIGMRIKIIHANRRFSFPSTIALPSKRWGFSGRGTDLKVFNGFRFQVPFFPET